jgi:hypothetical protein
MSAIAHASTRLPEDVTALAEKEMNMNGREAKNAVTKTYHTLKDLFSSKFKKEPSEMTQEELNNVSTQVQQQALNFQNEDIEQPYNLNTQNQHQISWNHQLNMIQQQSVWQTTENRQTAIIRESPHQQTDQVNYSNVASMKVSAQRAISQPQLNVQSKDQLVDRGRSLANIDATDSDEGGFVAKQWNQAGQQYHQPIQNYRGEIPQHQIFNQQQTQNYITGNSFVQQTQQSQIISNQNYQTPTIQSNSFHLHQQSNYNSTIPDGVYQSQKVDLTCNPEIATTSTNAENYNAQSKANDYSHSSTQLDYASTNQSEDQKMASKLHESRPLKAPNYDYPPKPDFKKFAFPSTVTNLSKAQVGHETKGKQIPGSAGSSDYDKGGNISSNVDSGRGSAAYSSGRKALMDTSPDHSDALATQMRSKKITTNDSEWIDIVDAELRHILEPGLQNLNLRSESIVSGSISSVSPPLPPLSQDESAQCTNSTSNNQTNSNATITNKIVSSKPNEQV